MEFAPFLLFPKKNTFNSNHNNLNKNKNVISSLDLFIFFLQAF